MWPLYSIFGEVESTESSWVVIDGVERFLVENCVREERESGTRRSLIYISAVHTMLTGGVRNEMNTRGHDDSLPGPRVNFVGWVRGIPRQVLARDTIHANLIEMLY